MEVSREFNQPYLIIPDLWGEILSKISYKDLTKLFQTSKFDGSIERTRENFQEARQVWCKKATLVTFIDTLYHAYIKKADDAFSSILRARHEINDYQLGRVIHNEEDLKNELFEWIDDPARTPNDIQKVAKIAIKAGYVDLFEHCYLTVYKERSYPQEIRSKDPARDLLFYAYSEGNEEIRNFASSEINRLPSSEKDLIICSYLILGIPLNALIENEKNPQFIYVSLINIAEKAMENGYKRDLENGLITFNYALDIRYEVNTPLFMDALKYFQERKDYSSVWMSIIEKALEVEEGKRASKILQEAPLPILNPSDLLKFLLKMKGMGKINFITQFIDKVRNDSPATLVQTFFHALKKDEHEMAHTIFKQIKNDFNPLSTLSKIQHYFFSSSLIQTESEQELDQKIKEYLSYCFGRKLIINVLFKKEFLWDLVPRLALPQDLRISDFNLFSSFKQERNDWYGKPVLCSDTKSKRTYIVPEDKSLLSRIGEIIKMEPLLIATTVALVVKHAFNLIKAIFTWDTQNIKNSAFGFGVTPLAFLGMEIGLMTHFILPEQASKLYYASAMSLNAFVFSPNAPVQPFPFEPSFLHKPVQL